jgi:hypothetical protein
MKHHKNSRDVASPAPAPQHQIPFSPRRNSTPTQPAAPRTSPLYVLLRTPSVAIEKSLINVSAIRNLRKQLKTITNPQF